MYIFIMEMVAEASRSSVVTYIVAKLICDISARIRIDPFINKGLYFFIQTGEILVEAADRTRILRRALSFTIEILSTMSSV